MSTEHKLIGRAVGFRGEDIQIHKAEHERKLPNGEYESYTVSVGNNGYGFETREDLERFLYGNGEEEYTHTSDRDGGTTTDKRRGLGLAKGMVADYERKQELKPATAPQGSPFTSTASNQSEQNQSTPYTGTENKPTPFTGSENKTNPALTPVPGSQGENVDTGKGDDN